MKKRFISIHFLIIVIQDDCHDYKQIFQADYCIYSINWYTDIYQVKGFSEYFFNSMGRGVSKKFLFYFILFYFIFIFFYKITVQRQLSNLKQQLDFMNTLCICVFINWEGKSINVRFKIDLVSYPARAEGLVNMINVRAYLYTSCHTFIWICMKVQNKFNNNRFPSIYVHVLYRKSVRAQSLANSSLWPIRSSTVFKLYLIP